MYYVYILKCNDGSLYTGITNRMEHRLAMHNAGKASHYTASKRPVMLLYKEEHLDRSSASKREYEIKQLTREQKLSLISSEN